LRCPRESPFFGKCNKKHKTLPEVAMALRRRKKEGTTKAQRKKEGIGIK
jgi:hypothetical protein